MSFLKIGDRAAGAISRAVPPAARRRWWSSNIDHPDIEQYINWKVREEQKVAALVTGRRPARST